MKKLLMLAVAVMAFAIPASASANFAHSGGGGFPFNVAFTGPASFVVAPAPTEGVHCETIHTIFVPNGPPGGPIIMTGNTNCTTTSGEAPKNGLAVDVTQIGTWTAEPHPTDKDKILITNVHINNKVTAGGMVVGESTLRGGTLVATIPAGQTGAVETVSLSDEGATVQQGIPPAGAEISANISGDLTSNGTLASK